MSQRNDDLNLEARTPAINVAGKSWYVKRPPTVERIADEAAEMLAEKVIAISAIFAGLIILALSVIPLIINSEKITIAFFDAPNFNLAGILCAVLAFCFAFYRLMHTNLAKITIPHEPGEHSLIYIDPTSGHTADVMKVLSQEGRAAINSAFNYAHHARQAEVEAFHLFLGSLQSTSVRMLFLRLGIDFDQLKDPLRRHSALLPEGQTVFGVKAQEVLLQAFANVLADKRSELSPIEIFIESYKADSFLQELFYSLNVEEGELLAAAEWMRINEQLRERYKAYRLAAGFKPTGAMNRAYTSVATPFLDHLSSDLTVAAVRGQLPLLVGREREMENILSAIDGGGRSVVLVGPSGVGKDTLIAGIAERMVEEQVPKVLQDKRLVELSVPEIISVSNTKPEERLLFAMREAAASGNIVLVIQGIDQLALASNTLISVLSAELERGYTFVIATASPAGWRQLEQTSLAGVCSPIKIDEPERDDALKVLESRIGSIEHKNQVTFTFEAAAACVDFATRYLHDAYLPEKAITLAQEVALQAAHNMPKPWGLITKEHVAAAIKQKTGVPVQEVTGNEKELLMHLEERMHGRVIGQDIAITAVAAALRRARTQLRATNRPIANFLFLGPTGVGKTELAKTTSEVFFGNENAMIRFDMSEYQEASSIERLIGTEGQTGILTEAIRKQPFALLLLDELEKAHPDLLNLFLQVMDDGRLTDGTGRTIDFTNIILIATSNAGTVYIQDEITKGTDIPTIKTHLMENELRGTYRPEFLNRFDDVIVFKPLSPEDVVAITYLMLKSVTDRLAAKGIAFLFADEAAHALAAAGYDPKFGARPLRRIIQERIDNKLADLLLTNPIKRRDTIKLLANGELEIEKASEL